MQSLAHRSEQQLINSRPYGRCNFINPVDSITNFCGTARRAFIATNLSGRAIFVCNSFIFGRGRLCLPTAAW
jgi:hypothetical protein